MINIANGVMIEKENKMIAKYDPITLPNAFSSKSNVN